MPLGSTAFSFGSSSSSAGAGGLAASPSSSSSTATSSSRESNLFSSPSSAPPTSSASLESISSFGGGGGGGNSSSKSFAFPGSASVGSAIGSRKRSAPYALEQHQHQHHAHAHGQQYYKQHLVHDERATITSAFLPTSSSSSASSSFETAPHHQHHSFGDMSFFATPARELAQPPHAHEAMFSFPPAACGASAPLQRSSSDTSHHRDDPFANYRDSEQQQHLHTNDDEHWTHHQLQHQYQQPMLMSEYKRRRTEPDVPQFASRLLAVPQHEQGGDAATTSTTSMPMFLGRVDEQQRAISSSSSETLASASVSRTSSSSGGGRGKKAQTTSTLSAHQVALAQQKVVAAARAAQEQAGGENGGVVTTSTPHGNSNKRGVGRDGEDVWSPDVEEAFLEGAFFLYASPFTLSDARELTLVDVSRTALSAIPRLGRRKLLVDGRAYGRNELIAAHIEKRTGKQRTRKQVSSHIQVLKNAFKHDPVGASIFVCPSSHMWRTKISSLRAD